MIDYNNNPIKYRNPEILATDYLNEYFGSNPRRFPISPFEMLNHENVSFTFGVYEKLEGVYIPADDETDIPVVGINVNRDLL